MTTPMLAPVRRPPHDPLSLLLDVRTGWPVLDAASVSVGEDVTLARDPATLSWPTDPTGSFGGLRLPDNVAVGEDGTLWLLDRRTGWLMRFEACDCAFVPARKLGTEGYGAIAVCAGRLFVTEGAWLRVLALPTTALAAKWRPAAPYDDWQPAGVAVDQHRQVHVADPNHGVLHTFSWTGRHLGVVPGTGASTHLAVALDCSVYAAGDTPGASPVYRVAVGAPAAAGGGGGTATPLTASSDDLAPLFASPPVRVDPRGYLFVGPCCVPPTTAYVDLTGAPATVAPLPARHPYLIGGSVILGPLDSRIDNCVWHRVILHAGLPAGCSVTVRTFTAHAELPSSYILGLDESAWRTRMTAPGSTADGWDCLLRSDPGRFLWLRLDLAGTGAVTPSVSAVEVEYPRISLRRYLPAVYGEDADSAEFTDRFLGLFDRSLRDVELLVDGLPADLDAGGTPYLDWLASWVGLTLDARLPDAVRRRLLASSPRLYDIRGTLAGLRELLIIVLGLDVRPPCPGCGREPRSCRPAPDCCGQCVEPPPTWEPPPLVLEHFRLRRWLRTGASRIGDDAVVWGAKIVNRSQLDEGAQVGGTQLKTSQDPLRDPFWVYAHKYTVFLPAAAGRTEQQRKVMAGLLAFGTPAHTAGSIEYVEPRFRIGVQSSLGLDSVVARVPSSGLVVNESRLGQGTALSGDPTDSGGPRRLGTTSVLA